MSTELAWVIDPDGDERYIPLAEAEGMAARNEAHYCQPDLDGDDAMAPHWHAHERWPEPLLDGVAPHIPGTDYYDGRDGSIEADEDDEETIADAEAHREDWQDYLEFQRTSH